MKRIVFIGSHYIFCRAVDKGNYIFGNIVTNNLPSLYYLYQDVTKIINSEETTVVDVKRLSAYRYCKISAASHTVKHFVNRTQRKS